ncbi:MAG: hypothetical protein WCB68_17290 [Pyrinomonadaceae bacterium]
MSEEKDFFDDWIDDEESETDDFDIMNEDEEDEDDDLPSEVRTVLMTKNDMLALLGLKTSTQRGLIVRIDPRQPLPSAKSYEDAAAATRWFNKSLHTSRKNGWGILYDGPPLFG